ncbi:MAG: uroporphyrinogen-III synthase [Chitinophagaceae bacterium]
MPKHKVLSTKKLGPSLIELAKENDIEIIEQEFIQIKKIWSEEKFNEIASYFQSEYVVFTSANAINTVNNYLLATNTLEPLPWKIYTLIGRSKDELFNTPLFPKNIIGEADNAKSLAEKIVSDRVKEIVFFCGNKKRDELPAILKDAGVKVHEVVVYETVETPQVVTDGLNAIMFFSPSAVQSFFSANELEKETVCFSIGETTAKAIRDFTDNRIIISESPSQGIMLASVNFYFQNISC